MPRRTAGRPSETFGRCNASPRRLTVHAWRARGSRPRPLARATPCVFSVRRAGTPRSFTRTQGITDASSPRATATPSSWVRRLTYRVRSIPPSRVQSGGLRYWVEGLGPQLSGARRARAARASRRCRSRGRQTPVTPLIYDDGRSRTLFRFARNPLFCRGSIIPIMGERTFIQPDTWIWTRRVNRVPPLDDSS